MIISSTRLRLTNRTCLPFQTQLLRSRSDRAVGRRHMPDSVGLHDVRRVHVHDARERRQGRRRAVDAARTAAATAAQPAPATAPATGAAADATADGPAPRDGPGR